MLSIIDIIEDTTVDGPGFRTAIYAAGCPNKCPGCHNPESWDIHKGKKVRTEEIVEKVLADEFANVTFSGGDPMFCDTLQQLLHRLGADEDVPTGRLHRGSQGDQGKKPKDDLVLHGI